MAARDLPNLALKAFFDLGEDGWDDEMSLNLLKLSVLVQPVALDKVSADPGAPVDGDVYIFDETHPTQANKVAIRDDGAWVYVTPFEGWLIFNQAADYYEKFDGTTWAELETGGGGSGPTPSTTQAGTTYTPDIADSNTYIRMNNASAITLTIPPNADVAFPIDTVITFEQTGDGAVTVSPGSGVTINSRGAVTTSAGRYAVFQIKKLATDTWTLLGDLA